ncbi:MAG TPA: hypothetical protein ENI76_00865 [Ignavibacteria bacterium]|nr:hypothetical protein [Ignavibacteria bacterium]
MKLLLFSEAPEYNFQEQFEDFFQIPMKNLKVAFIPNARDLTVPTKRQHATENLEKIVSLGFDVEEIDLLNTDKTKLKKILETKDIIWMHGGFVSNLAKAMRVSGLTEYLEKLLDDGLMYVGSSAGSMVLGENLDTAVWLGGEEDSEAKNYEGLGFVDFNIYPHYNPKLKKEIWKFTKQGEIYYLLEDGQAIGVKDGDIKQYGDIETIK